MRNRQNIRLVVTGALGRMGGTVCRLAAQDHRFSSLRGADRIAGCMAGISVCAGIESIKEPADVVVDFSAPQALDEILSWCTGCGAGCVLCATGYTASQQAQIRQAAAQIPVFQSANCAPGVWLLAHLVRQAAAALPGYDIEILEAHHSAKKDAPSGTALLLADAVDAAGERRPRVFGRGPDDGRRTRSEVGIHAIRAGSITGTHTVLLAGPYETLSLTHSADSRQLFAFGALEAAAFLAGHPAGYYTMEELIP